MIVLTKNEMNLFCSGLMIDNFMIEFYSVGYGTHVLLCPCLHGGARTRSIIQLKDILIHTIADSETD